MFQLLNGARFFSRLAIVLFVLALVCLFGGDWTWAVRLLLMSVACGGLALVSYVLAGMAWSVSSDPVARGRSCGAHRPTTSRWK